MASQNFTYTKISELTESTTVNADTVFPATINGETKKIKYSTLLKPTTQEGTGTYAVNATLQMNNDVLAHNIYLITLGRYGYSTTIVIDKTAMEYGLYNNGVGGFINGSRSVSIGVSATGLITILSANDPVNIVVKGIL